MSKTFYDLLDVSDDASTAEIEAAYREAVKEVHPDVSDVVDASERTKRLNRAKRVLTEETERARYDRMGHEAYVDDSPETPAGSGGAAGPGDEGAGAGSGSTGSSRGPTATDRSERRDGAADPDSGARDAGTTASQRAGRGTRHSATGRDGRERRREAQGPGSAWPEGSEDATGPSRASRGPTWQSQGRTAGGVDSPSARRQAAAGSTDGPNVDWSWNAWARTRSWAVRQGEPAGGPHSSRLFPAEQSVVLLASTFLLYPVFVVTVLVPTFPLVVRAIVAVCTVFMFAYLLSIPEVAIVVYGVWSVLVPVVVFLTPGLGIFSLAGVVGLSATWVPLGLSVLTYSLLRP